MEANHCGMIEKKMCESRSAVEWLKRCGEAEALWKDCKKMHQSGSIVEQFFEASDVEVAHFLLGSASVSVLPF